MTQKPFVLEDAVTEEDLENLPDDEAVVAFAIRGNNVQARIMAKPRDLMAAAVALMHSAHLMSTEYPSVERMFIDLEHYFQAMLEAVDQAKNPPTVH